MLWTDILKEHSSTGFSLKQTFQEQFQKAVLTYLSKENIFQHLVLQEGTALRLFYHNPRFSEDLDFVSVEHNNTFNVSTVLHNSMSFLHSQFPFLQDVSCKKQKEDEVLQRYILTTHSSISDQHIRLHVEYANVPSYENEPRILSFPPLQPVVRVKTQQEILIDKFLALCFRPYLKGRDLWDIYYLTKEQQISPQWNLLWKKTNDYHCSIQDTQKALQQVPILLQDQGTQALEKEMQRFLPPSSFSSYKHLFPTMIKHISSLTKNRENPHEGR
jgi:predicted nucleotidyltransferase component of viral defense system